MLELRDVVVERMLKAEAELIHAGRQPGEAEVEFVEAESQPQDFRKKRTAENVSVVHHTGYDSQLGSLTYFYVCRSLGRASPLLANISTLLLTLLQDH